MKRKKYCVFACFVMMFILIGSIVASAETPAYVPYNSYGFDNYGKSVAAPAGYVPAENITGETMGLSNSLDNPSDIFYDNKSTVYILDSGNSRIIAVDKSFKLKKIYDNFRDKSNNIINFVGAQGFTVGSDGTIYVADTQNSRVLIIDQDGNVKNIIYKPITSLVKANTPFDVSKVLLDNQGQIYVLAKSVGVGAYLFDSNGGFLKFWGSNPVELKLSDIFNNIVKTFSTKAQISSLVQTTPVNFLNFDINNNGFIFTVSAGSSKSSVRELNYKGDNVLGNNINKYGDSETDRILSTSQNAATTKFCDVDIDSQGFINLLDSGRGKVFQYTTNGALISVFGAYGDRTGTFGNPVALESIDDSIYVLDANKNCIFKFNPTAYVNDFRNAILSDSNDNMNESLNLWNKVLQKNTNNLYAYYGIGKIYDAKGDFNNAMTYFKASNEPAAYSNSFNEYRKEFLGQNFVPILIILFLLISIIVILVILYKKHFAVSSRGAYSILENKYAFPFYTLLHPSDGFAQFKSRKIQSYRISIVIGFAWFFALTYNFFCTGFSFTNKNVLDYSFPVTLMQTVGLLLFFCIANWAVCTLFDGKGSFKEIIAVVSYSLVPYIISLFANVLLSNVLTSQEATFLTIVSIIGIIWSVIILFCGLYSIHEYSFAKTLFSIIATLLGILIIIFFILMFYTLLQQTVNFVISVYSEASLR
jgi:hypothetical protein